MEFVVLLGLGALIALAATAGAVHEDGLVGSLDAGEAGDELGDAVAVGNQTALVGAPGATVDGNEGQGAVNVYERRAVGWIYVAELTAPDGAEGDSFGAAVDLHGDTAIVGARSATVGGNSSQGAAYVFEASEGNWTSADATKLVASDGDSRHLFGTSVAVHEDTALVGATGVRGEGGLSQGAAYVFEASSAGWADAAETKLTADDGDSFDRFGSAVALDADRALVGAPQAGVDGNDDAGAAYVFAPVEASWSSTEQTRLTTDGAADDRFGSAVALNGDALVVGAQRTDVGEATTQGAAHVFVHDGSTWDEAATLHATHEETDARFGASVAIHGDAIAVGAPQADVGEDTNQGDVHLFAAEESDWANAEATRITADGGDLFDRFGAAVALHGDTLLAGAPNADPGGGDAEGTAYTGTLHLAGDPPSVTIDQVGQEGQPLLPGDPIEIQATAEAGGSAMTVLEVAVDGEQVAPQASPEGQDPFLFEALWTPETPGTYTLTVTVTDEAGASASDSRTVEVGSVETPELAVLDEVFPPVAISQPAEGDTVAAGEEVAFTGTLRTGGHHGFVIVDLPGGEGLLATAPEAGGVGFPDPSSWDEEAHPEPSNWDEQAFPNPDSWDGVTFPGGTAGPFDTVTIETEAGEVSIPENGDIFEEIRFPGGTWVEVEFPGDTSAEPMPGSDWEEIRFSADALEGVAFRGAAFETVTVETEDGDVSFPGDTFEEIRFPGDTFHQVSFPGDTFEEVRFPGDTFSSASVRGDTFETVTVETADGPVSFPGDTFSRIVFPGDTFDQVSFPGGTAGPFEEVHFPAGTFTSVSFPGGTAGPFETVTIETENGDVSFPGDTFSRIVFPGDTFDQVSFPGDTFEEVQFPGDTFTSVSFPGDTFQTVTIGNDAGTASFPGDTFVELQFSGDSFDQVNFLGDTFSEISFQSDALASATFAEGSVNRMTLSTTDGSQTFPGGMWDGKAIPGGMWDELAFTGDGLDEVQLDKSTLEAEWSAAWTPEEAGTHEAAAVVFDAEGEPTSQTVTFTVEEEPADAPGFGVLVSVLVVGGLSLVLRRW